MYGFVVLLFQLCYSNFVVLINMHSVVGIYLPMVVSCLRYIHDCIPCNGININAFQRYHFVPKGVVVDLLVNVKEGMTCKVLTTSLE
jgi:hypothetical protein